MKERVNACKPVPASPAEPGSTSNSPWKAVGTLDRCQGGMGRETPAGPVLRSQSEASPPPTPTHWLPPLSEQLQLCVCGSALPLVE